MGSRLDLQTLLETLTSNVYFQPPPSFQMTYPCIVYQRSNMGTQFADNISYRFIIRYQLTVIDRNPDSTLIAKVASLPRCTFDRHFAADGLNHDAFVMWF